MNGKVGIVGIETLKARLEAIGRDAETRLPSVAARALASLSTEAFNDPALRPSPWPPLAESTLARIGAASDKAMKARDRAAEFRRKAYVQDYATVWLEGKAREKAARKAEAARKKAKEWRGRAKDAKAAAIAGKKMLFDHGTLFRSIRANGNRVVSDREYAVYHQFGSVDGRHPPARPFVPVKEDGTLVEKARRRIGDDLADELRRILRRR